MKYLNPFIFAVAVLLCSVGSAMAIEEAAYTVIKKEDALEVRDYAPHLLAETEVDGTLEAAGSTAFDVLFDYISGNNTAREKIAMTAPVSQEAAGEKIAMTAPVGQQASGSKWIVSFMMPASYTLEALPTPNNAAVKVRAVPAHRVAAIRYSGFWSEKNYRKHKNELLAWIEKNGFRVVGEPVWARYNPPFTPWFLRRNEILIPIAQ